MNDIIFNIISLIEYNNSIIDKFYKQNINLSIKLLHEYQFDIHKLDFLKIIKKSSISNDYLKDSIILDKNSLIDSIDNISDSIISSDDDLDIESYDESIFDNNIRLSLISNETTSSYDIDYRESFDSHISDKSFEYNIEELNEYRLTIEDIEDDFNKFIIYFNKMQNLKQLNYRDYINLSKNSIFYINLEKIYAEFNKIQEII